MGLHNKGEVCGSINTSNAVKPCSLLWSRRSSSIIQPLLVYSQTTIIKFYKGDRITKHFCIEHVHVQTVFMTGN